MIKLILAGLGGVIITYIGVCHLMTSYEVNNPHVFIMYFFSSSFMILVGLTLMAYFICHLWSIFTKHPNISTIKD
ncbi:MAG: hypothetical protein N2572_04175 [Syntrophales bacterium]|nr:hypothetical protein [Syntrophales bacterium]